MNKGEKNMKLNIYQKLHKAACEAGGVAKGKKVPGMHFNPLQHDEVQKVAMESLLNNGLYPICTYTNYVKETFIMVTCSQLKIVYMYMYNKIFLACIIFLFIRSSIRQQ